MSVNENETERLNRIINELGICQNKLDLLRRHLIVAMKVVDTIYIAGTPDDLWWQLCLNAKNEMNNIDREMIEGGRG